jgi:hypothetical protein
MSQPITWRNVENRDNRGAARLMDSAGQNLNAGIESLRGALTNQQNIQEGNRDNRRTYNDDQFKNALSAFSSPDELAAAEASGQLESLRSFSNMDQSLVRDGVDDRRNELQTEQTNQYEYDQSVYDQQAAPLKQTYQGMVNRGEFDEANAFLKENENALTDSGDFGDLTRLGREQERAESERVFTDQKRVKALKFETDNDAMMTYANMAVNAPTELEGRAMVEAMANNSGLGATAIADGIQRFSDMYAQRNNMTPEMKADLDRATDTERRTREQKDRDSQTTYQQEIEVLPVSEKFAWADDKMPDIGDVVKLAEENGWDDSRGFLSGIGLGETISSHLKDVKTQFLAGRKAAGDTLTDSQKLELNGVFLKVIEGMGKASQGTLMTDDLQDYTLKDNLDAMWREYTTSEDNRRLRNEATGRLNSNLTTNSKTEAENNAKVYDEKKLMLKNSKSGYINSSNNRQPVTLDF